MIENEKQRRPAVSLLMAVYKNPDVLLRGLMALNRQSFRDFEVIVCDDGSDAAIRSLVDRVASAMVYPLRYVWQADQGFRKCRILNRGILHSTSDYIIVMDADCIPHRHFVRGHMEERHRGCYLAGRRLWVGERLSQAIRVDTLDWQVLESPFRLLFLWFRYGGGRHLEAGIYLPRRLRECLKRRSAKLKGCNMSFWQADIQAINGFEEIFEIPCGGEDTDLARRFKAIGLRSRSVKHAAICYHLHHPLLPRDGRAGILCRELAAKQTIKALRGLAESGDE